LLPPTLQPRRCTPGPESSSALTTNPNFVVADAASCGKDFHARPDKRAKAWVGTEELAMARLTGKVALVTGGSRGIGRAIARRLAADGADVAITYAGNFEAADDTITAVRSFGVRGLAMHADAADAGAVKAIVPKVIESFGRLDVLVNNAGIFTLAPLVDCSDEDFERIIAINVRAVFLASREAAKVMGTGGRIITIGSVNADRSPFPGCALYSMTKAAVAALTKAWARDLGPRGITVTCVQPGPIETDMNPASGEFAELLTAETALGRYGTADEVATLVAFLASSESANITGCTLNVDGGFNA
jgi:3-oxoacyl-[acyl-carrier protein] reductase